MFKKRPRERKRIFCKHKCFEAHVPSLYISKDHPTVRFSAPISKISSAFSFPTVPRNSSRWFSLHSIPGYPTSCRCPLKSAFTPFFFHQKKEKRKKPKKRTQRRKTRQNQSSQLLAHSPLFHTNPTPPPPPPPTLTLHTHPPNTLTPGNLPIHQRSLEVPVSATKMPPSISAPYLPLQSASPSALFPDTHSHTIPHVPFESCCSHLPTAPSGDLPYPDSPPPPPLRRRKAARGSAERGARSPERLDGVTVLRGMTGGRHVGGRNSRSNFDS